MSGPLDGVRVFDFTIGGVGPFATMILANMGANVVKVEQGPMWPPAYQGGTPNYHGLSVVYMNCQLGKRSINLDLKDPVGKEHALRLLRDADVFAENMSYGTVQRLGLSYEEISRRNPSVVYGNFPGWGDSGPYVNRGSGDTAVQAFSGAASANGRRDGEPELIRWYALHDFNGSLYITFLLLLGLLHKERTGKGLRVLNPQVGASIAIQTSRIAEFLATGQPIPRMGSATTTTVPNRAYLCKDNRWLAVGVVKDDQWTRLCKAIGAKDLLDNNALATNRGRVKNRDLVDQAIGKILSSKTAKWWEIQLHKAKVPVSLFYDYTQILDHPQVKANNIFVTLKYPKKDPTAKAIDYPNIGKYPDLPPLPFGNIPFQYSKTRIKTTAGMLPGAHTQHILEEGWGGNGNTKAKGYFGPTKPLEKGILDGVTVIDMTQGITGPYASLLLADSGARVIKVEPPEGDYTCGWEPAFNGTSATFFHLNRNKEGLRLDVRKPADRERLKGLLKEADIFIEEEGQATLKRMGLDQASLEQTNPRLVTCSISPFGTKGPLRNQPASELVLQAMSDFPNNLGVPGEEPVRIGADMASSGTSLYACHAILGALYHQWRTGKGQLINVSQVATLLHERAFTWTGLVNPDDWVGFLLGWIKPPDHPYKTADQPITLGAIPKAEKMPDLMKELGLEHRANDPLFKNPPNKIMGFPFGGGLDHGDTPYRAKPIWEEGFKHYKAEDLVNLLEKYGSRSVVVNDYRQLSKHPQTKTLDIFATSESHGIGEVRYLLPTWKLFGLARIKPTPYKNRD